MTDEERARAQRASEVMADMPSADLLAYCDEVIQGVDPEMFERIVAEVIEEAPELES